MFQSKLLELTKSTRASWKDLIVDVSPEMASDWLEKSNKKNRRISDKRVAAYSRIRWVATPMATPICWSVEGFLMNGHHRLLGVKESNRTGEFLVCWDVPTEHLMYGDIGMNRTARQIGRMFDEDTQLDHGLRALSFIMDHRINSWISPTDLSELREDWYDECSSPSLRELSSRKIRTKRIRAGMVAACILALKVDRDNAESFLSELVRYIDRDASKENVRNATVNLCGWIENCNSLAGNSAIMEDSHAVAAAFEQYVSRSKVNFVKPGHSQALERLVDRAQTIMGIS